MKRRTFTALWILATCTVVQYGCARTRAAEDPATPVVSDDEPTVADLTIPKTPIASMPREADAEAGQEPDDWSPVPFTCLGKLPRRRSAPVSLPCPNPDLVGTVYLEVQLRKDGTVREVVLVQGFEEGCDDAALTAVRSIEWTPGFDEGGSAVDVVIPYEYSFIGESGSDSEAAPQVRSRPPRASVHRPCKE